jgi:hypothetical protein
MTFSRAKRGMPRGTPPLHMTATAPAKRLVLLALAALLVVCVFAGSASGRAAGIRFVAGQKRIVQGNTMMLSIRVSPANTQCALTVRYKGGETQNGLPVVTPVGGRATWRWRVPRTVEPGPAKLSVWCPGAGRASRTLTVIGGVIPAKIQVVKSGWSERPYPFGGTGVSYGVILSNTSPQQDAMDVTALVNFVMADNRLIGSATVRVSNIAAGTQHAMGGELHFPAGAPIARLEVVVTIGKRGPATRGKPGLSQIRVMPSIFEPQWAGSVEGEIQNDSAKRTLQSAELSGVILDAAGNVIGGGSGYGGASLPPAARVFFKIENGMRPISMSRVASALVSVVPTYKTP